MVPKLLEHVNPWLCSQFLEVVNRSEPAERHVQLRAASHKVHMSVKQEKPNWRDASIYCMFQIAAYESLSQLHISQGFALLNLWRGDPPVRNSAASILDVTFQDGKASLMGTALSMLTSRFASPRLDPITIAVCAGGGRPFSDHGSALHVLQKLYREHMCASYDPVNADAVKRDGNQLESFGAVVMMISSWSPPQDLLKNIAFHCGVEDTRSLDEILASVASKEIFVEMLTSCVCNLVPLKESEREHFLSGAVLGFYTRNRDLQGRDGTFAGPTLSGKKRWKGGAEFKNWSSPVTPKQLSDVISGLVSHDLDIHVFMAPSISKAACDVLEKGTFLNDRGTEWLVLHLRGGTSTQWAAFPYRQEEVETITRRKVLIIVEIGIETQPFCVIGRDSGC
ncbi:hypothetical protein GUITHDRAFT_121211 [Guillardia theta CCMP2712]|uniref:Uncharacterized protein n=1 Tax=Guillardia theta (strain CCMP2712) TaxID=905079 RepID=L1I9T9_GUITC|nr:hypothetical protein GUITHDRAFT_121211 [Guillardia theta CCMP2712]EKX32620.1 hypothetical protein GUITHDRAFT_121211 [Guillardia theta CCMP2712]|eukprot:XP_005819600.1 hypothetical protein GUITHDRAFT_121211 [Guillardia theta CCMP2712]